VAPPAHPPPLVRSGLLARYRLREVIGTGGMGTVYEAEDESLGRRVALKLQREDGPKATGAGARARAERFLREARITAMLEHPNIVPVLEVGELEDGVPYYTQRLVSGRTLAKALASAADLPARLALLPHFLDLCHAIAFAHGRGVIHRDIKPGNVMVGPFGETVVVDWGLARLRKPDGDGEAGAAALDPSLAALLPTPFEVKKLPSPGLTLEGQAVGTPGYMSPEQAAGRLELVDEKSDVFSLGAVLFEILVGHPPFTGKSHEEVLKRALAGPIPQARGEGIPPDLAAVAAKALSLDREGRYADAAEMEADVSRWSEGKLVGAYRYSAFQRVQRLANRHRIATLSVVVTLLVAGAWLGSVWGRGLEAQRQRAAERTIRGMRDSSVGKWDHAAIHFAEARVARDTPVARWGEAVVGASGPVPLYSLKRPAWQVGALAFAPDGKTFAAAGADKRLRIIETATGLERVRLELDGPVTALAYTADGLVLAAAVGQTVVLVAAPQGARQGVLQVDAKVRALALAPAGGRLAVAAGNEVRLFDLVTRAEVARTRAAAPVETLGFLPSGELVFGGPALAGVRRWDPAQDGKAPHLVGPATLHAQRLGTCDGPAMVVSDGSASAFAWRLGPQGAPVSSTALQGFECRQFALSKDCRTLTCLSESGDLLFWDLASRVMIGGLSGTSRLAVTGALTADGERLIVGSSDHTVRLWSLTEMRVHSGARGAGSKPSGLAWSPDGALLVSTDRGGAVLFWDPSTGALQGEFPAHQGGARALAFPPAGARGPAAGARPALWATAGQDGVRLWSGRSPLPVPPLGEPTTALAFAPSGQTLAAGGEDGALRLIPLAGGAPVTLPAHSRAVHALAYSPDGARLASSSADGSVLLWDPRTQRLLTRLEGHEGETRALAFSPDGRTLVTGSLDRTVRLWDPADGRSLGVLQAWFSGECTALAFVPLGSAPGAGMLVSANAPYSLQGWDLRKRELVLEVGGGLPLAGLAASPDGRRLAVLRQDGLLQLQAFDGVERLGSPSAELARLLALYKYLPEGDDLARDEAGLGPPAEK
jgi:serine/threonine protein kinase/WD40 repeat protein